MDTRAGARARAPSPGNRPARPVVTCGGAAEQPPGRCLRVSCWPLLLRELSKMLPNQNHPLTRAYMLGARSTTTPAYAEALRLIRACEERADQLTIDQCKLAAEILIERKAP